MGLRFDALSPLDAADLAPVTHYRARDRADLPVRHYESQGDTDTTLLLVHGSGSHIAYLAPLARRLSRRDAAHVYTPDLRGHGISPARRGDVDYIEQLEDDLADLVEHARACHVGNHIVVGGHSSGGGLTLRFAGSRHGGLADALRTCARSGLRYSA